MTAVVVADPYIDWAALGKVAGVSLLFGIAVVVLFSFGVVGLSMARGRESRDRDSASSAEPVAASAAASATSSSTRAVGSVFASVCFVLCAAAVGYGLYLIIPQFH